MSEIFDEARTSAVIAGRIRQGKLQICLFRLRESGKWGIPKGIVDPGHTPRETALNEAREEAGLHGELLGRAIGSYIHRKWGTEFRVSILESGSTICRNPELFLGKVIVDGSSRSIENVRKLKGKRGDQSLEVSFAAKEASTIDPDLCLIFTNFAERIVDGKVIPMPSADFHVIRLKDFAGH